MVANGFLPDGRPRHPVRVPGLAHVRPPHPGVPRRPASWRPGSHRKLSAAERAAYDAPYPNSSYQAGARAFPALVPTSPDDPAVPANRAAWERLGEWEKPFLTLFGRRDPILGKADRSAAASTCPGAQGQPHARLDGSHFVQEDVGIEIAERTLAWM